MRGGPTGIAASNKVTGTGSTRNNLKWKAVHQGKEPKGVESLQTIKSPQDTIGKAHMSCVERRTGTIRFMACC